MGNLEPTKGLFELIQAVLKIDYDIKLFIVGPGASNVIDKIKILAGVDLGHKIILMGGMANEDVINFMKTIDILVLPTYYKAEAFPISILEAMSLGKIVISTERAAIKDMLTGKNGNNCGLFVKEKSVDDIVDKIKYCIENHNEAELLMKNAYNKVWESYRKEVVYDIYRLHYSSLIQ
ncbi:glycosyltransferase family 4 protein [Bacteroides fragilis]